MISRIHRQLGTAGFVISIVALIAALGGGAYAASGVFSAKEKKEIRKIAKSVAQAGPQGPAGAPGTQGLPGAPGANGTNGVDGKDGDDGTNGTNGTNGESVSVIPLAPDNGSGKCEEGGAKFLNGTGEAFACNAEGGSTAGYPETLPSGRSETGFWEVQGESGIVMADVFAVTTISFPLPLAAAPTETILIGSSSTDAEKAKCPGTYEDPKATAGILCLYVGFAVDPTDTLMSSGAFPFGAGLLFDKTAEMFGSWAVKAA